MIAADAPQIEVWDWPLRLFHWALVAAVSTALASGLAGGAWMQVHGWAGQAIALLLVFRLAWGRVGTRHARFRSFWPSGPALVQALRGRWRGVGHNPLGALSVIAVLLLLLTQVLTGLIGDDEIGFQGPWAHRVSESLSLAATGWHKLLANLLWAWLGLHTAAVVWHQWRHRQPLLQAMVSGKRPGPSAAAAGPVRARALLLALALVAAATVLLLMLARPTLPPPKNVEQAVPVQGAASQPAPSW